MELSSFDLSPFLFIGAIGLLLVGSLIYGIYITFGSGAEQLTDQMEEHARLHKRGIAHTHSGNGIAIAKQKIIHNHKQDISAR